MTYKYIIEGKIGRYIKNDSITGLCTDNITSCCIIVLISADHNKRVMIHADRSLSKETISAQLTWVGNDCEKFIFMRKGGREVLKLIWPEDISTTIEIIRIIPEEHEFVFINNEGNTPSTCLTVHQERIEYHPQAAKLLCYHQITGILFSTALYQMRHRQELRSSRSNPLYLNPLLFDENWIDYNTIELHPATKSAMETHEIADTGIYSIYNYAKFQYDNRSIKAWYSKEDLLVENCGSIAVYYYLNSLSGDSQTTFKGYLEYNLNQFKVALEYSGFLNSLNSADKNVVKDAINLILEQTDQKFLSKLMSTFEVFFNKLSSKKNIESLKGTFQNFIVLIIKTRMLGVAECVFSNTSPQPAISSSSSTPSPQSQVFSSSPQSSSSSSSSDTRPEVNRAHDEKQSPFEPVRSDSSCLSSLSPSSPILSQKYKDLASEEKKLRKKAKQLIRDHFGHNLADYQQELQRLQELKTIQELKNYIGDLQNCGPDSGFEFEI